MLSEFISNLEKELQENEAALRKLGARRNEILNILGNAVAQIGKILQDKPIVVASTPIEKLGLCEHTTECLKAAGIMFVEDLTSKTEPEIQRIDNIGASAIAEIRKAMQANGSPLRFR